MCKVFMSHEFVYFHRLYFLRNYRFCMKMSLYSPIHSFKNYFSIYYKQSRVLGAGNTVVYKTIKPMLMERTS